MGFIVTWFWYLVAFVVGSAAAWVVSALTVKHTSEEEALADLPGAREIGAGR